MKKGYLDYKPLDGKPFVSKGRETEYWRERNAKKLAENNKPGFVTKSSFELVFGFGYPKTYKRPSLMRSYADPKTLGSNGKIARFR